MSNRQSSRGNPNRQGWEQFVTARKEMLDDFDKAKQQDKLHKVQTYRGRVAEAEFRKWLSSFLPRKYGVTAGYVISQRLGEDVKVPHFDVIIYDRLESPILWIESNADVSAGGTSRAIPAEYVCAVIEVKSSFTSTSAKQAANHLLELKPLLKDVDTPRERYKKYLPPNFFHTVVFFELRQTHEYSLGAVANLVPAVQLRQFFGPLILRGEGLRPLMSGKFMPVLAKSGLKAEDSKVKRRSLLSGGLVYDAPMEEEYLRFLLLWGEALFAQFAFDLVALLNGTYEIGRLSSFHGFGLPGFSSSD